MWPNEEFPEDTEEILNEKLSFLCSVKSLSPKSKVKEKFQEILCFKKIFGRNLNTAQKKKVTVKNFISKCEQIRNFLRICLHY